MASGTPPFLTVVAHNDVTALRSRQALTNLQWSTRAMAANLLAIMDGSGSANDLAHQILDLANAVEEATERTSAESVCLTLRAGIEASMLPLAGDRGPARRA